GGGWGDVGIELDQTSLHLGVGESQRVWAFVFGTANHNVRWETANALYATVDEGSITAHRTGFVVIRAIPLANQSQWAEVSVWIGEGNVVPVVHSFTFTEDAINYNIRAYVRMTNRANFAVSVHFRFLSFDLNDGQNFRTGYNLHALRIEANDYWDGFFTFQILRTFATPRRLEISYLRYVPLP
ncbi:MAG: Ig-like domain-containing protein, partial [Firmicutes bacterium]|nr:Ig-like domain-containing protein [Bacillota bacterium]